MEEVTEPQDEALEETTASSPPEQAAEDLGDGALNAYLKS